MGWKTVDDAIHDMRNALKCSHCVGYQISNRKPNNIEEKAANKMGIPWVYKMVYGCG